MPTTRPKGERKLTAEEHRLIRRFVTEGATDEKIARAAQLAKLSEAKARVILKRPRVQLEIHRRMEPVRLEHERQNLVADAVAQITAKLEAQAAAERLAREAAEKELAAVIAVPRMKVAEDELEHQLMRLVVGLDQDKHPQVKLAAIQAGYVILGAIEHGTTRRVIPMDKPGSSDAANVYTSLFARIRQERLTAGASEPAEIGDPDAPLPAAKAEKPAPPDLTGVFELTPGKIAQRSAPLAMPEPGEALEEPPPPEEKPAPQKLNRTRHRGMVVDLG